MKPVLIIAYHFPPLHGSSGLLRTLKFARYLPEYGYKPIILTVPARIYEQRNEQLLSQIPDECEVHRAFALDTRRHLSFKGAYLQCMALPDRMATWIPFAILQGIRLAHHKAIQTVISTYPIASAHVIGNAISKLTKINWIADFRDPMWDEHTFLTPTELKFRKRIEALSARQANFLTVTTAGMKMLYLERYKYLGKHQVQVVENGFDEADFVHLNLKKKTNGLPIRLTHTGLLEPQDRNPLAFFAALKNLLTSKKLSDTDFMVELYAPGSESFYFSEIQQMGLSSVVQIMPAVPYRDSLERMAQSDILLLFQGPSCNRQIPAKLYEYFRIGRPILALTPKESDTARMVEMHGAGQVVAPDNATAIAVAISKWIDLIKRGITLPAANRKYIGSFSRQCQTARLASLLNNLGQISDFSFAQAKTCKSGHTATY